ncbi:hypothetical protein FHT08_003265 [Xanthomonas campestris]|nr:hypothetical protein [Xanthomonas sp. CFBP 8151]
MPTCGWIATIFIFFYGVGTFMLPLRLGDRNELNVLNLLPKDND